jgi:hypothetical protein
MSLNFLPKNISKGTNSDGSKFTFKEYDYGTYLNIEFANFFIYLLFGALFSSFVSFFILIYTILYFNGRFSLMYILGIIFSCYFLYDCYHGWLLLLILSFLCDSGVGVQDYWIIDMLVAMNIGVLLVNVALIIFGGQLYSWVIGNIEKVSVRWLYFVSFVLIVFIYGYQKGNKITNKDKEWVERKLELGKYNNSPYHVRIQH